MKNSSVDIYKVWIGLAAFVIIIAGVKAASAVVIPILLSIFIATIAAPAVFWLENHKLPRVLAFLIVLLSVIAILLGFGYILSTSLDNFLPKLRPTLVVKICQTMPIIAYKKIFKRK